jgi:hypothetical protein
VLAPAIASHIQLYAAAAAAAHAVPAALAQLHSILAICALVLAICCFYDPLVTHILGHLGAVLGDVLQQVAGFGLAGRELCVAVLALCPRTVCCGTAA